MTDLRKQGSTPQWNPCQYQFRYQLSDKTLFSARLKLLARNLSINDFAETTPFSDKPNETLPTDCDGFLIRSLPIKQELTTLLRMPDYIRYVPAQYPRHYIDMRQSFEEYTRKFSSKTRSTINRKLKKFSEHSGGRLDWRAYKTPDEMREFHRLARSLSSKTYQEALLDAGLPEDSAFVQEMLDLASSNSVRAFLLLHADRPVAYLYCPVSEGILLYEYLGYDPEYRNWSPGTILQWLALEYLFHEGSFSHFDFTEGESDHKRLFGTHEVQCANVFFLKRTLRNTLLVSGQYLTNRFSEFLGHALDHYGLKPRLKRLIRFGFQKNGAAQ